MKKPRFKQFEEEKPICISTNGFWSQWCCKCKTRHIWFLKVVRSKNPNHDYIEVCGFEDKNGTALRKFWEKQKQK